MTCQESEEIALGNGTRLQIESNGENRESQLCAVRKPRAQERDAARGIANAFVPALQTRVQTRVLSFPWI